MSLTVFGGSLEFVAVSMLLAPFAPAQVMAITCMVQARHLFYGIAMLDRYRGHGLEEGLPDLRAVRRDLLHQLWRS